MKKKLIILFLVMLTVNASTVPVLANSSELSKGESLISPMFTYIFRAEAELYINSSGKATVETYVTGNSEVTSAKATIRLQQYKNGIE